MMMGIVLCDANKGTRKVSTHASRLEFEREWEEKRYRYVIIGARGEGHVPNDATVDSAEPLDGPRLQQRDDGGNEPENGRMYT